MPEDSAPRPSSRLNWLLWWRIDPDEVTRQVEGYRTLSIWKTARGSAALCLVFSAAISVLFVVLNRSDGGLIDVVIMLILAALIYFGQGWACLAAMVVWSVEKAWLFVAGVSGQNPNGGQGIVQLIWWCFYMHAFLLAFRVERRRKQAGELSVFS